MTFCLDSVMVKPEANTKIKNAIILLHGYGGCLLYTSDAADE